MNTTLDGKALFDDPDLQLDIDSLRRASIEQTIPGLDGVASIDLGQRSRTLRQRGVLRAPSLSAMHRRMEAIEIFLDGDTHTLVTSAGQTYSGLRLDAFTPLGRRTAGAGIVLEYEIVYTQLGH